MRKKNRKSWIASGRQRAGLAMVIVAFVLVPALSAQRSRLKPGWNLFTPAQDVEAGRQVSADAEKKLAMLNDRRVNDYLDRLGKKLAAQAPFEKYPYSFKGVNDMSINAFALPGGFLYVNRGTIEAADDEAQLAGVMAHEISHAALRHGTNQASKAYLAQVPLAILGGIAGTSVGGVLAQVGAGFAADSVLLKYSRDAERQADLLGTQLLCDAGYDPRAIMQFFEKLRGQEGGGKMPQWLSTHPDTENRINDVSAEIGRLGGPPPGAVADTPEFQSIRKYAQSLPKPKEAPAAKQGANAPAQQQGRPPLPSKRLQDYANDLVQLRHPNNWAARSSGAAVMLAPDGGVIQGAQGDALAYGMMIDVFAPQAGNSGRFDLQEATDQLIRGLRNQNPNLRVTKSSVQRRVNGERALSTYVRNDAPLGGAETDWIVTVLRPEGLVCFVGVAPEDEFGDYRSALEAMIDSVRFVTK
jgi:beta-barrel assembly-enhancing protease